MESDLLQLIADPESRRFTAGSIALLVGAARGRAAANKRKQEDGRLGALVASTIGAVAESPVQLAQGNDNILNYLPEAAMTGAASGIGYGIGYLSASFQERLGYSAYSPETAE